jgi:hypothetical protein
VPGLSLAGAKPRMSGRKTGRYCFDGGFRLFEASSVVSGSGGPEGNGAAAVT